MSKSDQNGKKLRYIDERVLDAPKYHQTIFIDIFRIVFGIIFAHFQVQLNELLPSINRRANQSQTRGAEMCPSELVLYRRRGHVAYLLGRIHEDVLSVRADG